MLRVRVVSPPALTDVLVAELLPVPGVVSLAVDRGTSVKPPGDVVVIDVVRECANEVLDAVEALGLDRGEITLSDITADRSELADDALDASERAWDSAGRGALVLLINVVCLVAGSVSALVAQRYLWAHMAQIPVGLRGRDARRSG